MLTWETKEFQISNLSFYLKKLEKKSKIILKQAEGRKYNEEWNKWFRTDCAGIKKIIKEYYKHIYTHKSDHLGEMDQFLRK